MSTKRIAVIAIIFALLAIIGIQRVQMANGSSSPNSPGALRVVENGKWLLFHDYICAKGTITVSADKIKVVREGRSISLSVEWTESNHTYVDNNIKTCF